MIRQLLILGACICFFLAAINWTPRPRRDGRPVWHPNLIGLGLFLVTLTLLNLEVLGIHQ